MVNMYPHKLYVVPVGSSRNADGYVVSQEGKEQFIGACRLETQGKASQMIRDDGEQVYTSAVIYAHSVSGCVNTGQIVLVRDSIGRELIRKPVINSSKTQLHIRIWV